MIFPYSETITLLRENKNRFGDVVLVEERQVANCGYAPTVQGESDTTEATFRHSTVITGRTLYLPPDSGVLPSHRVRFTDGSVWEIVGDVSPWRSFMTGWYPGDQAEIRRVTG
jgi:hypothetical protein